MSWSISPSTGSINSSSGLYTAPTTFPSNNQNVVTITATSTVASTVSGTTTITVQQPTTISTVTCQDPNNNNQVTTTVSSGNSLVCTALTSTGNPVSVDWTIANANKLGGNIGSISPQGTAGTQATYTAPLVPPPGSTVTVTATSPTLSSNTLRVNLTVTFGNRVLSAGNYVFSTVGRLNNTNAFFARTGVLTVSPASSFGTISGIEDTNQSGTSGTVKTQRKLSGSYSVGADGRGSMQFCENGATSCPLGSAATASFLVVVVSPQQVELIETSASTTSKGELIAQDQSVFGLGNQALSGTYSFNFAGISSNSAIESVAGEFTSNGFGTIDANGSTTPGVIDVNVGGAVPTSAASRQIGTGILPATIVKTGSVLAFTDGATPFSYTTVANDTLSNVVTAINGNANYTSYLAANSLVINAASGNAISFTTNSLTDNSTGAESETFALPFANNVSYTISGGRGTGVSNQLPIALNLGGFGFSFYVVSASHAKFIEIDSSPAPILVGDAYLQQMSTTCGWGLNALSNSVVFQAEGVTSGTPAAETQEVGTFAASNGSVSSASVDVNVGGTYTPAPGGAGGSYTMDPSGCGRGTLSIASTPPRSYVFYPVSTTSAVLQETTSGVVTHGLLTQSSGGPFANASLTGSYAFALSGTDGSGNRADLLGQFTSGGTGTGLAGTLDQNDHGIIQTGVAISKGTYVPSPSGTLRGTVALTSSRNLVIYLVSPTLFYALDMDPSGTAIGAIYNQF